MLLHALGRWADGTVGSLGVNSSDNAWTCVASEEVLVELLPDIFILVLLSMQTLLTAIATTTSHFYLHSRSDLHLFFLFHVIRSRVRRYYKTRKKAC